MGIQAVAALGSLVFQTVSAFSKANQEQKASEEAQEIAVRNFRIKEDEATRQQEEENLAAREKQADRVRQANAELGALRVATAENGVTGTTFSGLAFDLAYTEGLDLARIDKNRESRIDALQADKNAAHSDAQSTITKAKRRAKNSKTAAFLGLAGSAFGSFGRAFAQSKQQQQATNVS